MGAREWVGVCLAGLMWGVEEREVDGVVRITLQEKESGGF